MELPQGVATESIKFNKGENIISDIAEETKDNPDLRGLTNEQLIEKVENILLEHIKEGKQRAYFQLGLFYYEQEKYDKALHYFERSKDFDFQSLYHLSVMLYDGIGCEVDTKRAVEYLKKLASSTSRHASHLVHAAQFNLGKAYFQGFGVERQSDEIAERWWLMAADDGNPRASVVAQTTLGMFYSREDCQDLRKTFFWHSEACGNGSLESQGALGVMYEYGIGVRHDSDAAYICLKEAADRGNVFAMGNLVAHYYRRKLFTKAADLASKVSTLSDINLIVQETDCLPAYIRKGISLACFYYARCLTNGLGTKKNPEEAKFYYSRSFQFDPDMCARLQNITQHGTI